MFLIKSFSKAKFIKYTLLLWRFFISKFDLRYYPQCDNLELRMYLYPMPIHMLNKFEMWLNCQTVNVHIKTKDYNFYNYYNFCFILKLFYRFLFIVFLFKKQLCMNIYLIKLMIFKFIKNCTNKINKNCKLKTYKNIYYIILHD